jgi:hypothetical protein
MSDPSPDDLMRQHEPDERDGPQFDADTRKVLLEVANAWRGWSALFRGLRLAVVILGTAAGGVLAWDQLVAKLRSLMSP